VPKEDVAVANTTQISETPDENGLKAVRFATSKPLPSYLIAFAVGPFGIVDAGTTRGGAKLRIITLRGGESGARYAAEVTGRIVALLEDYLGVPYPFDKLDSIAVPKTVAFGAMENRGSSPTSATSSPCRPARRRELPPALREHRGARMAAHLWFARFWAPLTWWDWTWLYESPAIWPGPGPTRHGALRAPEWRRDTPSASPTHPGARHSERPRITRGRVRRPVESERRDNRSSSSLYTDLCLGQGHHCFMVDGLVMGAVACRKGYATAYPLRSHPPTSIRGPSADLSPRLSDAAGTDGNVAPVIASSTSKPVQAAVRGVDRYARISPALAAADGARASPSA
jgi:hypothetical protein